MCIRKSLTSLGTSFMRRSIQNSIGELLTLSGTMQSCLVTSSSEMHISTRLITWFVVLTSLNNLALFSDAYF